MRRGGEGSALAEAPRLSLPPTVFLILVFASALPSAVCARLLNVRAQPRSKKSNRDLQNKKDKYQEVKYQFNQSIITIKGAMDIAE